MENPVLWLIAVLPFKSTPTALVSCTTALSCHLNLPNTLRPELALDYKSTLSFKLPCRGTDRCFPVVLSLPLEKKEKGEKPTFLHQSPMYVEENKKGPALPGGLKNN